MAPRCTGTCGALATRRPAASKMAQEKSQPLLDVHATATVLASTTPVCSATLVKRLLNSSSSTGSGARCADASSRPRGAVRCSSRWLRRGDLRGPAGLDHGGGVGLPDQRRAGQAVAGEQGRAVEHRAPHALRRRSRSDRVHRLRRAVRRGASAGSAIALAGRDRLHRDRFDDQRALRRGEAEAGAVGGGEGVPQRPARAAPPARPACPHSGHGQRRSTRMRGRVGALRRQRRRRLGASRSASAASGADRRPAALHRLLPQHRLVRQAHPVGRQHAGERDG